MRRFILGALSLALAVSALGTLGSPAAASDPTEDSAATAALETAQAILSSAPLARGAKPTVRLGADASLALADLVRVLDRLTPTQRKQAQQLLARPDGSGNGTADDAVAWGTSQTSVLCATHVCVHYVLPGVNQHAPDDVAWVQSTLDEMEAVYAQEVTTMGYRAPAPDGTVGGDSRFDVYLANLGPLGLYGYCAPEAGLAGQINRYTAYCVLDDDYTGFPLGPFPSLQVTAAHEFFHAIQFNYDTFEDRWLMEATATWMEERYADAVDDNRQYIKYGQTRKPGVPLDTFEGLTHYGNWTFFEKLSQNYGIDSVRVLWAKMDGTRGAVDQSSIQALKNYLAAHGTTFQKFYGRFAAGNLDPARSFSEGAAYPAAPWAGSYRFKASRKTIRFSTKLKHLTSKSYRINSKVAGTHKAKISIDGPAAKTGPAVVVSIYKSNGSITRKLVKLNGSGDGSVRVNFSRPDIKRLTITLANASTRYNCGQFTSFACMGVPRDNGTKFAVTAKLL